MKNFTLTIALFLGLSISAQTLVPTSKSLNTTDPPNLSWIVGEFEVIDMNKGEAILAPIKHPTLPRTITVRYSKDCKAQYPFFGVTQKLWFVIREGQVSQIFQK